jgi:hypothetical protein
VASRSSATSSLGTAASVEEVEALEAREDPEDVLGVLHGHVRSQKLLFAEASGEPGHAGGAALLALADRAADSPSLARSA